jgi:hypothetical protein
MMGKGVERFRRRHRRERPSCCFQLFSVLPNAKDAKDATHKTVKSLVFSVRRIVPAVPLAKACNGACHLGAKVCSNLIPVQ